MRARAHWTLPFALAICVLAGLSAAEVVATRFPTEEIVIAERVLWPAGGDLDDAPRLQSAIDAVHAAGGGTVFLHAGHYRLDQPLRIRSAVALRGDWTPPGTAGMREGTVLQVRWGADQPEGLPALMLHRNGCLREVTVYYPRQDPASPRPYPWSIAEDPAGYEPGATNNTLEISQSIIRVTLVNPWRGVRFGPEYNALFYVDQLHATPLHTGLAWDMIIDIGRVHGSSFSPRIWEEFGNGEAPLSAQQSAALRSHLLATATGFDFGRHDWGYLHKIHVEGLHTGMLLRKGERDGIPTNAVIFDSRIIDCRLSIDAPHVARYGFLATGCTFAGIDHAVRKGDDAYGVLQFNSSELSSREGAAIEMRGGYLSLQNVTVRTASPQAWAVEIEGGYFSAADTTFANTKRHLRFGSSVKAGKLLSNHFGGPADVEGADRAGFDHTQDDEPRDFLRPDVSPFHFPDEPRPPRDQVYFARDLGVDPAAKDATSALQKVLDMAGADGGGTVYLAAGLYSIRGHLRVPTGVELRGSFSAPHQPTDPGTCLLAYAGREDAEGEPFLLLEPGAGLRGLTVFHPEQQWWRPRPYPWTLRSLGPQTWLIYVTLGNSHQGVDLWTHRSDGHYIKYLAGCFFRKGLWVSKTRGPGWIRDVHQNPHNTIWTDLRLNAKGNVDWDALSLKIVQQDHLEFLVLGSCDDEHVLGTFTYGALAGISFRADHADAGRSVHFGPNARVIQHGSDLVGRCFDVQAHGGRRIEFINNEFTPRTTAEVGGLITTREFDGEVGFFNNASWARGRAVAQLEGGRVHVQQLNNLTGPFRLGGRVQVFLDGGFHQHTVSPQLIVTGDEASGRITGHIVADFVAPQGWRGEAPANLESFANSQTAPGESNP